MTNSETGDLSPAVAARVLDCLGLPAGLKPDVHGLRRLYAAWCLDVPFDNLRKMVALRSPGSPLPGVSARDFFEGWLEHGAGGTCWPTSNGLLALLRFLGFDARRVAGSMRDMGVINHGSVKVRLGNADWLVDSSMLTSEPLPLGESVYVQRTQLCAAEVEPVDGTHVLWVDFPPNSSHLPCRLLIDPAGDEVHITGYESSRGRSPFNDRLYARRNFTDRVVVLHGHTRFEKTRSGLAARELDPAELLESLTREFGFSATLVSSWQSAGGLAASIAPASGPKPPPVRGQPPSRR